MSSWVGGGRWAVMPRHATTARALLPSSGHLTLVLAQPSLLQLEHGGHHEAGPHCLEDEAALSKVDGNGLACHAWAWRTSRKAAVPRQSRYAGNTCTPRAMQRAPHREGQQHGHVEQGSGDAAIVKRLHLQVSVGGAHHFSRDTSACPKHLLLYSKGAWVLSCGQGSLGSVSSRAAGHPAAGPHQAGQQREAHGGVLEAAHGAKIQLQTASVSQWSTRHTRDWSISTSAMHTSASPIARSCNGSVAICCERGTQAITRSTAACLHLGPPRTAGRWWPGQPRASARPTAG